MPDSTVPAAVDALITRITTAVGTVQVVDGPFTVVLADERVYVGVDAPLGGTAAAVEQTWASLGGQKRLEEFDVFCRVTVFTRTDVQKTVRDRAFVIFGLITANLRATPELLAQALQYLPIEVRSFDLDQTLPTETVESGGDLVEQVTGRQASITFAVHCHHRI